MKESDVVLVALVQADGELIPFLIYYVSFTEDISQIRCYRCKKPPKSPLSGGLLETTCYENYPNRNGIKYRPAIVLREMPIPYRDLLVCGVSTRLDQYVRGLDDMISPADADFVLSGLHSESLIRLSFLGVVPR